MTTIRKSIGGLAVCTALLPLPATAQTTAAPSDGRLLASNCFQCHGTDGRAGFEQINGKSSTEIYSKLKEMQRKEPGSEDYNIMFPHAKGYTDAQLMKISQYLSTIR